MSNQYVSPPEYNKKCHTNDRPCERRQQSDDNTCCHYPELQCGFCDREAEFVVHNFACCGSCALEIA